MAGSFLGMRNPPLAFRNVIHGGRRSLAAISGAAFSLVMVLLQLGFLQAVRITATNNFDVLDFELSDEEMTRIAAIDRDERMGPHPDDMN